MTAKKSSHVSSLRRSGVCIMLFASLLLLASSAYASLISIGFQEANVNSGMITLETTSSTGNATVTALTYGSFSVNDVSAQDRTILGPPGLLNSQTLDVSSTTAGNLFIWVTTQGLSFTGVQNFRSSFAVNSLSGSIVSVLETTYFSPTNGLFNVGATTLDSALFSGIGTKGPDFTLGATSGTYSVTEEFSIVDTGGTVGNDNLTIDLSATPIPEPASLGLVGLALLTFGGALRRKRTHTTQR